MYITCTCFLLIYFRLLTDVQQYISLKSPTASEPVSYLYSHLWVFSPQTKDIVSITIGVSERHEMFNLMRLCEEQTVLEGEEH